MFDLFDFSYFAVKSNKINSAAKESVISAPTNEKYVMPKSKGQSDITTATSNAIFIVLAMLVLPLMQ